MTHIIFTPTEDEIYRALNKSGIYKTSGKRMIIENIILLAFCVYFIVSFCINMTDFFALVMAVICAVLTFVIWFVPHNDMKKQAKSGSKEEIRLSISEQMIKVGSGEKEWTLPLDGSCTEKTIDEDILALRTPKNDLLIIPKRAIPGDKTEEITGYIKKGCSPAK